MRGSLVVILICMALFAPGAPPRLIEAPGGGCPDRLGEHRRGG